MPSTGRFATIKADNTKADGDTAPLITRFAESTPGLMSVSFTYYLFVSFVIHHVPFLSPFSGYLGFLASLGVSCITSLPFIFACANFLEVSTTNEPITFVHLWSTLGLSFFTGFVYAAIGSVAQVASKTRSSSDFWHVWLAACCYLADTVYLICQSLWSSSPSTTYRERALQFFCRLQLAYALAELPDSVRMLFSARSEDKVDISKVYSGMALFCCLGTFVVFRQYRHRLLTCRTAVSRKEESS